MSSGGANVIDIAEVVKAEAPAIPVRLRPGATEEEQKKLSLDADLTSSAPDDENISEDDLKTLVTNAVSSAIAQGFTGLSTDPLLVWNYASVGIIAFVVGIGFWISHRKLDQDEDHLNMLPEGHVHKQTSDVESDHHSTGDTVEHESEILGEKGLTTTPPEPHPASGNTGASTANEIGEGPIVRVVN